MLQRALEEKPGIRYSGLRRYGQAHFRRMRPSHRDTERFSTSGHQSPVRREVRDTDDRDFHSSSVYGVGLKGSGHRTHRAVRY